MPRRIALPRKTPGVIEAIRDDSLTAFLVRFPLPSIVREPVDMELSLSKGFSVRLDDGRLIQVSPGMGMKISGCEYSRSGFVADVPELVGEALFTTFIDPATAQLYKRPILAGTRVFVSLRGAEPKRLVSIKRVSLRLQVPDKKSEGQ